MSRIILKYSAIYVTSRKHLVAAQILAKIQCWKVLLIPPQSRPSDLHGKLTHKCALQGVSNNATFYL